MKLDNFTLDQVTSLKLPPYQTLKDIQFWMTAPDNSFEADGIEEGDLLGIFWPEFAEYFSTDEPRDIYVVLPIGQEPTLRLAKYDFTVVHPSEISSLSIVTILCPLIVEVDNPIYLPIYSKTEKQI